MNFALVISYENDCIEIVVYPFSDDLDALNTRLTQRLGRNNYYILDTDTNCNRLKVSAYDMMHFQRSYDKLLEVKADWDTRRTIQETKD